jgi:hypothetical protein
MGIENDPLTGGSRLLEWTGGSATITNRSGASKNISNNWICVSGRYGVAAGPAGYFKYQAASSYNRLGAAQDTLQFLSSNNVAARYAIWFPGKTAAQTASGVSQVSWSSTSSNATLIFPGLDGAPAQVNVTLPPALAAYTPYLLPISNVTASSQQAAYPPTNTVDGNYANYWVSFYAPTNHAEWLKVTFPRIVAISEFMVYPRTDNGGYGPKGIQMFLNVTNSIDATGIPSSGTNVYAADMLPTTALEAHLAQPVTASNAVLVITSGYDRGSSTNPRNTQVVELMYLERAQPGTFGDWALHNFTDVQLANPDIGAPGADPDNDGVPNLVEFAMGGAAWVADSSAATLQPVASPPGTFRFYYQERKNLGDVLRSFETSTNVLIWSSVSPSSLSNVADLGSLWRREATFPAQSRMALFRLKFTQ